jgi:hypothetical protein
MSVIGKYLLKIYAHLTKYRMLWILACMVTYSAALDKAVLLVTLVSVPACEVEGEGRLGFKPEVTFKM